MDYDMDVNSMIIIYIIPYLSLIQYTTMMLWTMICGNDIQVQEAWPCGYGYDHRYGSSRGDPRWSGWVMLAHRQHAKIDETNLDPNNWSTVAGKYHQKNLFWEFRSVSMYGGYACGQKHHEKHEWFNIWTKYAETIEEDPVRQGRAPGPRWRKWDFRCLGGRGKFW